MQPNPTQYVGYSWLMTRLTHFFLSIWSPRVKQCSAIHLAAVVWNEYLVRFLDHGLSVSSLYWPTSLLLTLFPFIACAQIAWICFRTFEHQEQKKSNSGWHHTAIISLQENCYVACSQLWILNIFSKFSICKIRASEP